MGIRNKEYEYRKIRRGTTMINKKGQSLGLSIMSFILIILVGLMAVNFLMTEVSVARVNLDCSNAASIEDGNKLLCLVADLVIPYWIWIIIAIAIGAVTARFVL